MRKSWYFLILLSLTLSAFACQFGQSDTCPPRLYDDTGYLVTICEYIIENDIDVSPKTPQSYNIVSTDPAILDGLEVIEVYLDCCSMGVGDIVYVEKQTGEVISFHLGDR